MPVRFVTNIKCCPFQISEVQVQVTQNTEALQGARTEVNELRRQIQTLEIELESQRSLVSWSSGSCNKSQMGSIESLVLSLTFVLNKTSTNSSILSIQSCRKDHWRAHCVT